MVRAKVNPIDIQRSDADDNSTVNQEGRNSSLLLEDSADFDSKQRFRNNRIIHVDPGLLTPEQLLRENGGRRRSLQQLIIQQKNEAKSMKERRRLFHKNAKNCVLWLLDEARIRISFDDVMLMTTLFVLFGHELRLLYFSEKADVIFEVLHIIAFMLFLVELLFNSWVKSDFSEGIFKPRGYTFSFFFWLDLIALLSLIPDIQVFASLLKLPDPTVPSRSSLASLKFARVLKKARLIRLVKLYSITSKRKRDKQMLQDLQNLIRSDEFDLNREDIEDCLKRKETSQSKVGIQLADIITRRVIVAVLLMLFVVPYLSYDSKQQDEQESLEFLQAININSGYGASEDCEYFIGSSQSFIDFMGNLKKDLNEDFLLGININPVRCNSKNLIDFMRAKEISRQREGFIYNITTTGVVIDNVKYQVNAVFSARSLVKEGCYERISSTILVITMLVVLSHKFANDADKLILKPIDNMMEMVNLVANEPLEDFDFDLTPGSNQYETIQVQVAIKKITELLRVGFGIAGANIISMNMSVDGGNKTAVLNPMIPGNRVYAIFGFCDIHDFDLCTEKLEDEIMTFVNQVASIVHEEVTRWEGLCNKNLGNAFLMVWRIGDEEYLKYNLGGRRRRSLKKSITGDTYNKPDSVDLRRIPGLDDLTDKALIGFLKVIVAINRDPQILSYRKDERLFKGKEKFKLRMGFGLHAGWAIEGAVGSLQKVDATYLSPHVNMAARMEAASRQFGVPLLLTHNCFELMSKEAQECCRKVDVVTVKGSAVPMPIYTSDAFQNQHFATLKTPKYSNLDLNEILIAQALEYSPQLWKEDEDLVQLRRLCTPDFLDAHRKGIETYLNGDWTKARLHLEQANMIMNDLVGDDKGDGPSQTILRYMRNRNWSCPGDWQGFRPLTSK